MTSQTVFILSLISPVLSYLGICLKALICSLDKPSKWSIESDFDFFFSVALKWHAFQSHLWDLCNVIRSCAMQLVVKCVVLFYVDVFLYSSNNCNMCYLRVFCYIHENCISFGL